MKLKIAGLAMTIGGFLFFVRMVPVLRVVPDDMAFPPESDADLVRLVDLAGIAWPVSHALGLIAMGLFVFGYWSHRNHLKEFDRQPQSTWAAWVATIGFGAFAIALIIDGFGVPSAANTILASETTPRDLVYSQAGDIHKLALRFFTPGVFLMFIAIGLLSTRLIHRLIHNRTLGFLGMLIAISGPTVYLFGLAGPNWDNLRVGGSLMMLAFLWHLLIGLSAVRSKENHPQVSV